MSLTCKQLPLPEQARLYGNLISRLTDAAVFLMNKDGQILSWNPGVERILGYTEEHWLGQSFEIIFTPKDRASGVPRSRDRNGHRGRAGCQSFAGISGKTEADSSPKVVSSHCGTKAGTC